MVLKEKSEARQLDRLFLFGVEGVLLGQWNIFQLFRGCAERRVRVWRGREMAGCRGLCNAPA